MSISSQGPSWVLHVTGFPPQVLSGDLLGEVRFVRILRGHFDGAEPPGIDRAVLFHTFCRKCYGPLGQLEWSADREGFSLEEVVAEDDVDKYTPLGFLPLGRELPSEVVRPRRRGVHGPVRGARAWWIEIHADDPVIMWSCECGRRSMKATRLVEMIAVRVAAAELVEARLEV